jgi:glycosyltransferase involved in cell wall biosynthesis
MIAEKEILFSIITPTFNRANMIGKAIESVINQTYANWEMIIIDDGSTDDTAQVIKKYTLNDHRIKYFYQNNQGRSAARNKGIDVAIGEYLSFLDDDDYYLEDFLFEFAIEIEKQKVKRPLLMCGQNEVINGKIIELKIDEKKIKKFPVKFLIKNSNNLQPFCIPKDILVALKFDKRFELGEDFHLLIRILLIKELIFIPKNLCIYVNHFEMTMEKELNEGLFFKLPFNRLDMLDDIKIGYQDFLIQKKAIKDYFEKYNQIAYFYSSASLKYCDTNLSLYYLKKIKLINLISFYFIISIYLRVVMIKIKFILILKFFNLA